ncbi:retrovirus-related Pol polyprotein from transposon TNT 1-94 [Caerostris extrusa]|uniref:Retrovirus-related Pol polyprotein from transposon TNT 1-94 n=1 Tax=Caerostris extrusa TaxID=172846 RepID=A0AAV4UQP9_CAEEX|nr:retrovirus-related Pol polyprotein from transposon TNT 1-94 [Caerostris extrusa]
MCISLASLNISNCKNISDAGMVNLCNTNNEDSGFNSLKTLNIIQTAVTRQGVITLLRHLRSLHWLYYKDLSKILYNLHKSDFENNPIRYNLKYFEYNRERVALRKMLEVWAVMCPFVTRISIQDKITNVDLELCKRFQNLKKFKITSINYHPRGIIISPFISVKGAMLTELKVMYATVSVETIVKSCPNLKQLFLFNVTFEVFSLTDLNNGNYVLDNMASLTVKHFDFGRDLLAFDSIYLLIKSSKYLNELCIQYIEGFTDVLADIILELPYLSVVDLSFTDIKNSTLFRFLIREHITQMSVDGCPDVSLDDNSINKLISENQSGNTCSWVIDYSEMACESMWDYSMWSGEIYM